MIVYDKLFSLLEKNGYTTYKIRKTKLMGNATYQKLKNGKGGIDTNTLDRLCCVLKCQPGDIMEYVEADEQSGCPVS